MEQRWALTKVGLVGTTLQPHTFGTGLDQEVAHQLVGQVAHWREGKIIQGEG